MKRNKLKIICRAVCFMLIIMGLAGAGGCSKLNSDNNISVHDTSGTRNIEEDTVHELTYAYHTLNEEEQAAYDKIFYTIYEQTESVVVRNIDKDTLNKVYKCVLADYGNIFWVSGYSYAEYGNDGETTEILFAPKYTMKMDKRIRYEEELHEIMAAILDDLDDTASDYEKAKYVYDYLTTEIDYGEGSKNHQNLLSVFLDKETVCQGYACAAQYVLYSAGIESCIITGETVFGNHAWNLVKLDGEYYYMDVTWGNSSFHKENENIGRYTNYSYFAVTTEQLYKTHIPQVTFDLPVCTATENSYFMKEGLFVTEWNPEQIGEMLSKAYYTERPLISIQMQDDEVYEKCIEYFFENQQITNFCEGIRSLYYIEDVDQRVLTLIFR